MIVTPESPENFKHPATGQGFDGVVRVSTNGHYGTGSLLYSGQVILTAAHVLLDDNGRAASSASVYFESSTGKRTFNSSNFILHPDYDAETGNFDLALVVLSSAAPSAADRYQLYRSTDEQEAIATLVGYGRQGTGDTGGSDDNDDLIRTQAYNKLELTVGELEASLGRPLAWQPDADTILIADFDNGATEQDILGQITGHASLGLGVYEGLIAQGDSGGPAFIQQQVAGVASYITRFESPSADIDTELNSSFGEVAFWQRVGAFQEWIDLSVRAQYQVQGMMDAQTGKPDHSKIPLTVSEGSSGSKQVFFLLEFNGLRVSDQVLSVAYQTQDGTAVAGEDYIATSGQLNLYADESYAWIPVEILGDTLAEGDETFYLMITNPIGGTFANGQTELLAMRTITNDDWV